jgi:tetratricopeptide (TPR) repeat protein
MAYCCTWLSWAYLRLDSLEKLLSYGEKAVQLAEELGTDHYLNHKALSAIGFGSTSSGQWKRGLAAGEKAVAYARKNSHLRGMAMGSMGISASLLAAGRFEEAVQSAEAAMEATTDPLYAYAAKGMIGLGYFFTGQMVKAREMLETASSFFQKTGLAFLAQGILPFLGVTSCILGSLQKGLNTIDAVTKDAEETGMKIMVSNCHLLKGMIFAQLAVPQQKADASFMLKNAFFLLRHLPRAAKKSEEHFKKAIAIGKEVGAHQTAATAHLELGRMLLVKKNPNRARENLMEAKRIFTELENDFYLQQVEKCLARIS